MFGIILKYIVAYKEVIEKLIFGKKLLLKLILSLVFFKYF